MQTTAYLNENKQRFLDELFEFLRIPSVSANSNHNADTRRTAEWVRDALVKAGVDTAEDLARVRKHFLAH